MVHDTIVQFMMIHGHSRRITGDHGGSLDSHQIMMVIFILPDTDRYSQVVALKLGNAWGHNWLTDDKDGKNWYG